MESHREDSPAIGKSVTGSSAADWAALLILLLLPFAVYLPVTMGSATFAGYDHTGINQPLKQEAFATVRSGDLPLWEHRLDRGLPLFAEGEAGIFYPLNLLFLIPGDFLTIYNLVLLLIIALAGLLFYWWVRRLGAGPLAAFLAGVAYQWGSNINFNKANMNIMEGLILAPLLMFLLEPPARSNPGDDKPWRRAFWIGLVFAAMLFAGQSQYVVYTGLFALAYVIIRVIFSFWSDWLSTLVSMLLPLIGGAILGAGLAAVQLFPTLELIPLSERAPGAIAEGFSTHGLWLSPDRLYATYIFPVYHYSLDHFLPYLSTTVYVGPIVILLAGFAIRSRRLIKSPALVPLLIAALVFLYLSMGANAPLGHELTSWGPLAHFRGHGRFGGYFGMAVIAIMALGLDAMLRAPFAQECDLVGKRKCIPLFIVELVMMALVAIPFVLRRTDYLETRAALGIMIVFAAIFIAGYLVGNLVRSRVPVAVALALTLVIQIIGFQTTSSETLLARSSWETDRADLLYIRDESQSPEKATLFAIRTQASVRVHERILRYGLTAFEPGPHLHIDHLGSANAGLMENLTICNSDLPLELTRWEWLVHQNLWLEVDFTEGRLDDRNANLLWILGVNWLVTENPDLEVTGYERLTNDAWENRDVPYFIYRREYPVPQHAVYWSWTGTSPDASEETVREAFFDYLDASAVAREVFLEDLDDSTGSEGDAGSGSQDYTSAVTGEWRSSTEYVAGVNVSDDAVFVLRDAWYPGWRVSVNGRPADLLRADLVFKAVRVPPGPNEVVFKYTPRYLVVGWFVSAISAILLIALFAVFPVFVVAAQSRRVRSSGHIVDTYFAIHRRIPTWIPIVVVLLIFGMILGGTRLIARGYAVYRISQHEESWNEDGVLMQSMEYSSAPCCLVMLVKDMGLTETEAHMAWVAGTGPEGTTPEGIEDAGKVYGFNVRREEMGFSDLMEADCPAIIEVNYEGNLHAVYVRPDRLRDRLVVKSPILGLSNVNRESMESYFGAERLPVLLFERSEL